MSPFIIYAIVLTIAYILYYATMITMDIHAKDKQESSQTENILMEDKHEEDDTEPAPKVVSENMETGSFDIGEPIQEAEIEQPAIENSESEELSPSNPSSVENHDHAEENDDEPKAEETGNCNETEETLENEIQPSEENEEGENAETEQNESAAAPIIPSVSFEEDSTVEEPEKKSVSDKDLFDADKLQPQYGITSINGNPVDEKVTQTLSNFREKLGTNKLSGNMFTASELKEIVSSSESNHNIETRNECTKC